MSVCIKHFPIRSEDGGVWRREKQTLHKQLRRENTGTPARPPTHGRKSRGRPRTTFRAEIPIYRKKNSLQPGRVEENSQWSQSLLDPVR